MRRCFSVAVLVAGVIAAHKAPAAEPLANVGGFDAGLLAGKTCQGTLNSGRRHAWSESAVELRFAVEANQLTAQLSRLVGQAAYDRAAYAMTRHQALDASGYEHLGPVRDLAIAAGTVRYTDPLGARVTLTYRPGTLSGQSDPRGGADRRLTRVQLINLMCR